MRDKLFDKVMTFGLFYSYYGEEVHLHCQNNFNLSPSCHRKAPRCISLKPPLPAAFTNLSLT